MNHTPLPWVENPAARNQICDEAVTKVIANVLGVSADQILADAALIVKAVNNHQKLVDALRKIDIELAQHPESSPYGNATPVTHARAISKALLAELGET